MLNGCHLQTYDTVCGKLKEISALSGIDSLLYWDQMVMMPPGGSTSRSAQKSALTGVLHDKVCCYVCNWCPSFTCCALCFLNFACTACHPVILADGTAVREQHTAATTCVPPGCSAQTRSLGACCKCCMTQWRPAVVRNWMHMRRQSCVSLAR